MVDRDSKGRFVKGNNGMLRRKHSEESKLKMSKSSKGSIPWNKGRKGLPAPKTAFKKGYIPWNKGQKMPEISGKNHHMYGKKQTPETIKKISESLRGNTPWNKGRTGVYSKEHLQQMSQSMKGNIPWNKGGGKYTKVSIENISKAQKKRFEKDIPWNKGQKMPEISGKNHHRYGKKHSLESIEKIRIARQKQKFPLIDSKPEKIIQIALSLEGIQYQKHKNFKMKSGSYHVVDIFIEPNICIEIDGCYWHSCKQCGYDYPPRIEKDKLINKSLKLQGYKVIRIWEHEIKESVNKCIKKIKNSKK